MSRFRWLVAGGVLLLGGGALGLLLSAEGGGELAPEEWRPPGPGDRVRVEVLNAGGRRGMARLATARLRDAGFDVVHLGNAAAFGPDSSLVLDRIGRPDAAEDVARALGIVRTRSEPDATLLLDVTVRLGPEWGDTASVAADAQGAGGGGVPWWDVRRLWR